MDAPQFNGPPGPEHNPNARGKLEPYICRQCPWTAKGGIHALEHHVVTGHAVRGKNWPESYPDAKFSTSPARPANKRSA